MCDGHLEVKYGCIGLSLTSVWFFHFLIDATDLVVIRCGNWQPPDPFWPAGSLASSSNQLPCFIAL